MTEPARSDATPAPEDPGGPPPGLSARSFVLALAALLAVFVGLNPIWEQPDVHGWTANVWWSYAPIPLVVAALLAWEGKFSAGALAHECLRLTMVKFVITYAVANLMWAVQGPPSTGRPPSPPPGRATETGAYGVRPPPLPSPLDPVLVASLELSLHDAEGRPVPDALVWLDGAWDDLRFTPPDAPARLVQDGAGFVSPDVPDGPLVVQAYQPLQLVSRSDVLHTAVLAPAGGGADLFNYPVVAGGRREVMFDRGHGVLTLHCTAHREAEPAVSLLVLGHPFQGRTDASGQLAWEGVPAGSLGVWCWTAAGSRRLATVELEPGATRRLELAR